MKEHETRAVYNVLKRCMDIVGAIIALTISAPILALAAVVIKRDGGPLFFVQERVGRNGKPFGVPKLRTMVPEAQKIESNMRREHAENGGYGVAGEYADPRITKVGSVLRLLNIDELPQFVNVLKGEMSLVGPRPVPYEESLLYGDKRNEVLSVKPGITGYWQVKRRMSTGYDERVEMDCYYVRNHSVLLDAYILAVTPISMLTSDYNSVTKPLPPPAGGVLIPERAVVASRTDARSSYEEPMVETEREAAER